MKLARARLVAGKDAIDSNQVPPSEYILLRLEYKNDNVGITAATEGKWYLEVLYAHPVYNDHTVLYSFTPDGMFIGVKVTE